VRTLTGTLRWVITTEVSFPLTEIEVWPEPEMALKAYSISTQSGYEIVFGNR
jgi:hypothetical protein